jgi:Rrf2 family transcriptional regulator, nitric oxide-sensitive transcriptional repressor
MRLTLYTDFAPRVLIQVGLNDGRLVTIKEIAQTFDISKAHLMKVVNDLSQKGYLDTVRGRNGGIRLMREPRDINIGQVVRDTENQLDVIGCLGRRGYCPLQRICVLRGVLRDAIEAFLAVLDTYTLADLIKPQKTMLSILMGRNRKDRPFDRRAPITMSEVRAETAVR